MKITRLTIEKFAQGEAPTLVKDNVGGDDLVIHGGNRSGKTLTFNAIIYGLLGSSATYGVSAGRSTEISFSFHNGDKLVRKSAGREFVHSGERYTLDEADEKVDEIIGPKDLLNIQFIHSETSELPLSKMSKHDRLSIVRRVAESDIEEELQDLAKRRDKLESEIENVERLKLRPPQESLDEIDIDKFSRRLDKFQELNSLIENGRLEEIKDGLLADEKARVELESLDRERRSSQKTLRKKQRELNETKRYDDKINSLILDAIQELTCPVCDHLVREGLAQNRLSRGSCPQCGQEGSLDDVRENLKPKIEIAQDTIDDLEDQISDLEDEIEGIESDIQSLDEDKIGISELNGPAVYALREHDYDVNAVRENTIQQIEKLEEQISELSDKGRHLEDKITDAKSELDELHEMRTKVIEQKELLERESFEQEISAFCEEWSDNYVEMAPNLAAEIELQEDGKIILPGTDRIRNYNHLSTGEMRLVNLAFALTMAEHANQNGSVTHNWNCFVLDEPFTNIDEEIRQEAIKYLKTSDFQFILTTSNDDVVEHFDTDQIESLERITIQSTIAEALENE